MNNKILCLVMVTTLIVLLSGCGKENKINEYDKENKIQVLADKEIIRDADYSEGNVVVPYINIDSSEVDEINNFLKDKAEELRSWEFDEINGEKFFIDNSSYTYYLDEKILSILFVVHSSEGDGCDWYYSYNIDLENNKVLDTRDVIDKIMDSDRRKKVDEKFLQELNKYLKNSGLEDYKEKAVEQYMIALDSAEIEIYVNDKKKIEMIIPLDFKFQYYSFIFLDTDIEVGALFTENNRNTENEKLSKIKGKVLDFSISDYKSKIINYEFSNRSLISDNAEYYELIDRAYAGIFPDEILALYGKYLPPYTGEEGTHGASCVYTATSTLNDGKYDYNFSNLANEFDKDNSWVEGKSGYGIGEKITVYMTYVNESCRGNMLEGYTEYCYDYSREDTFQKENYNTVLNGIYIVNGYAQNESLYKANSRVKKLKLTIDDKEEYILELEDTMMPQIFDVNYKVNNQKKLYPIKAEFEILEVYKGEKYEDTAINTLRVGCDSNVSKGGR